MKEEHFQFIQSIGYNNQGEVGRNALNFGNQVQNLEEIPQILNQTFDRSGLQEICDDKINSNLCVTVAILAWGNMRFNHARTLFQNWKYLNPIVGNLRTGQIESRYEAFEILQCARATGKLPGLGISYFTKLICFLKPNLNGYILDQWTGKSINLLWNEPLVRISKSGWVTDHNTPDTYEEFCKRVESLAEKLGVKPLKAEEIIFSVGGRNSGTWRNYLKENYPRHWV